MAVKCTLFAREESLCALKKSAEAQRDLHNLTALLLSDAVLLDERVPAPVNEHKLSSATGMS